MTKSVSGSQFVKLSEFKVDYAPAKISKWRSERTGLQITYIDQDSPIVNGYFAVATEIADDSGCPHTLEHLVFMGSKKYPYKGLLDSLSNRFFSSTNAWTAVDQTVYTLTTAGWEGFRRLLPIYLDHLFNPTLTDEACMTEVYHIDGKGKEKGVVFSEMQGIESQSWFITYLNMQKALYSETSGYSSETGGLMHELRKLTNDKIKKFHEAFYRPDNLCVIVTGSVEEDELLQVMGEFDESLPTLPGQPNPRPFVDSIPDLPLTKSSIKEIEFPDEDESIGEMMISWIGPKANETLNNVALDILGSYLAGSSISIFNKALVEIEDPLATEIDYGTDDYTRTGLNFTVSGVETGKLHQVDTKIKELLAQQSDPTNFDLKYVNQVLSQERLKFVYSTEKSSLAFCNIAISEFIYGKLDGSDLSHWTKDLKEYDILTSWSAEEWSSLLREQFVDNKSVSVLSRPSARLYKDSKKMNKKIQNDILEKYGENGLKELDEKLKKAQSKNDIPIPDKLLLQFGKPDPSMINFIKTKSYNAGTNVIAYPNYVEDELKEAIKKDTPKDFPMFLHFESFDSKFLTINISMSPENVSEELLPYITFLQEIFSLSLNLPSGEYVPYNEVISKMNDDLVEFNVEMGFERQFSELLSIKMRLETANYKRAIQWIISTLNYSVFEESRVKTMVEKIVNSLPDKKRSGEFMMYSSFNRNLFSNRSLKNSQDSLSTEQFFRDLLLRIENGEFESISRDLEKARKQLFRPDNFKVFIIGDVEHLSQPVSSWTPFVEANKLDTVKYTDSLSQLPRTYQFQSTLGKDCTKSAFLVSTPATESTYLTALTPIPTDYSNQDISKIALVSEILSAVEGPFWRGIRGTGLAYGAGVRSSIESGYLLFSIYRGADAQQAWETARNIVERYATGEEIIDQITVENAIAAIVNELANNESNKFSAATTKICDDLFKSRGPSYVEKFLKELSVIKSDELVCTLQKYFRPLFSYSNSIIVSCVPPSKIETFAKYLGSQGYSISIEEINSENAELVSPDENDSDGSQESSSEEEDDESDDDEDKYGN